MNYKLIILILVGLFLSSCEKNTNINQNLSIKKYKNSGFALVYNDNLNLKKLETRSLNIYHKFLKKKINCKNNK